MKKQTKKEREVYAVGRPSLEHLAPNEREAFFSTLLACIIEHKEWLCECKPTPHEEKKSNQKDNKKIEDCAKQKRESQKTALSFLDLKLYDLEFCV